MKHFNQVTTLVLTFFLGHSILASEPKEATQEEVVKVPSELFVAVGSNAGALITQAAESKIKRKLERQEVSLAKLDTIVDIRRSRISSPHLGLKSEQISNIRDHIVLLNDDDIKDLMNKYDITETQIKDYKYQNHRRRHNDLRSNVKSNESKVSKVKRIKTGLLSLAFIAGSVGLYKLTHQDEQVNDEDKEINSKSILDLTKGGLISTPKDESEVSSK